MSDPADRTPSAEAIRTRNAALDAELLGLFDDVPADRIHEFFGDEWTLADNLAHIAEFPGYFAAQLEAWLAGDRVVIGRVAEHDADRNDALARAPKMELEQLRRAVEESFAALAAVLEQLQDAHLDATTQNVKYGEEPLTSYLDRYVVGHKAAHVTQLREALDLLRSGS